MADPAESAASAPPGAASPAARPDADPTGTAPGLVRLNKAAPDDARALLREVCAARAWIDAVAARLPCASPGALYAASDHATAELTSADLDEAMAGHAVIGRPHGDDATSGREQAGVHGADDTLLAELADANREYADRFGHVFLIRATGRDAAEMLDALRVRLGNDPAAEREIVREQLREINLVRLEKLVRA